MAFETLKFAEPESGIGLITLNRPERLNALSVEMVGELHALFARVEADANLRVVILTGEGRGFCSGADLKDAASRGDYHRVLPDAAAHLTGVQKKYSGLILKMEKLPQPFIAAVNGPAAGGGMCLALASDIAIAGPRASFTPSFANIGLSGGEMGTTFLLPRRVGSARAAEILLTGRTVEAPEAEKIGIVSRVVEEGRLMDSAMEIARSLLAKSRNGLWMTKEALRLNLSAPSLEAAIELENRNQSLCCYTEDFARAVAAFGRRKRAGA